MQVGKGHYYVAGKLFENDDENKLLGGLTENDGFAGEGTYIAYLDVWQQHVTALDDHAIREVALGGPDTATRIRNRWQVKLQRLDSADAGFTPPKAGLPDGKFDVRSTGSMRVKQDEDVAIADNQLYRVEIHEGGSWDNATFKWSRDNGSVAVAVTRKKNNTLALDRAADVHTRFAPGQLVEVTYADEPRGSLHLITAADDATVTVDGNRDSWGDAVTGYVMRRWDGKASVKSGADGGLIPLENGIRVRFAEAGTYASGDYWLIAARVAGNSIDWPEGGEYQPPHGVEHAYVPLAKVEWNGAWQVLEDLRTVFEPLATGLLSKSGVQKMEGPLLIGTPTEWSGAAPTHQLHIAGNDATLRLEGSGKYGSGAKLSFGDADHVYVHEDEDDKLEIHADRVALTTEGSTGKIGIDTKTPGAKLEIAGNLVASGDGETLVGLKIVPTFDDGGKSNVTHLGLQVEIDGETRLTVASDGVRANLIQEAWIGATLNEEYGWQNHGEMFANVAYFKDSLGIVHFRGVANMPPDIISDPTNKCRVFILPDGYRPEKGLALPVMTNAGTVRVFIHLWGSSDTVPGEVNLNTADQDHFIAGNWISFDGITFRAAA